MHQFGDINNQGFYLFDRDLIRNKVWAGLPLAAKTVLPAIGCHCDRAGVAFPSELTLAILCGMTPKSVRAGIRALQAVPGFAITSFVNSHGKRALRYRVPPTPQKKGRAFAFHRALLDGGHWLVASDAAKALYLTMRHFGFYNHEEAMGDETAETDSMDSYQQRTFESCEADVGVLADASGLSRQAVYSALDARQEHSLVSAHLVVRLDAASWRVMLKPQRIFKREWLNEVVQKRYKAEWRSV